MIPTTLSLMSRRMARIVKKLNVLFLWGWNFQNFTCYGTTRWCFSGTPIWIPTCIQYLCVLNAFEQLTYSLQVFAVVGNWDNTIIPISWVIMQRRTEAAYISVFRVLRLLWGGARHVDRVISDFERAQRNAWEIVFPGVTLQGCFFHLVKVCLMICVDIAF